MEKPGDFEITYKCTNPKCGNEHTLLFFGSEDPLPVTCCTKCKAGFGVEQAAMAANHLGMFPVSKRVVEEQVAA